MTQETKNGQSHSHNASLKRRHSVHLSIPEDGRFDCPCGQTYIINGAEEYEFLRDETADLRARLEDAALEIRKLRGHVHALTPESASP